MIFGDVTPAMWIITAVLVAVILIGIAINLFLRWPRPGQQPLPPPEELPIRELPVQPPPLQKPKKERKLRTLSRPSSKPVCIRALTILVKDKQGRRTLSQLVSGKTAGSVSPVGLIHVLPDAPVIGKTISVEFSLVDPKGQTRLATEQKKVILKAGHNVVVSPRGLRVARLPRGIWRLNCVIDKSLRMSVNFSIESKVKREISRKTSCESKEADDPTGLPYLTVLSMDDLIS